MCILQCLSFLKYPNDKWKLYILQIQEQKQERPPTQQGDHAILQTEEILSNQLKADLHFVTPHKPPQWAQITGFVYAQSSESTRRTTECHETEAEHSNITLAFSSTHTMSSDRDHMIGNFLLTWLRFTIK